MSTLQAVIFGTSEQRPTFLARKNPGSGWGVDILWPDGETEAIKGFITELDAAKWIAEHSRALQGNTNDKSPQRPGDPRRWP
jgi:hypothetical protein